MTPAFLPEAKLEVAESLEWYDSQRAGLGDDFIHELNLALERILASPRQYRREPTYLGRRDVRIALLRRFPFQVIFHWKTDEIVIVVVAHHRREPGYWHKRVAD
jgi:toxin ParE1/3/4